jgi:hypothetical protein
MYGFSSLPNDFDALFNATAVMLFIFTIYKSVGETVANAWNGIMGTFLGSLTFWVLLGIWPHGAKVTTELDHMNTSRDESLLHHSHYIIACVFIWCIFWFKFDINTKVFASSTFVYLYMNFLNPDTDKSKYSSNFIINANGLAIQELVATSCGALLAVVATLVPHPLWATDQTKAHATDLVRSLNEAWCACGTWFSASEKKAYQQDVMIGGMRRVRENVTKLDSFVQIMWWECFGFGRTQNMRILLLRLDRLVKSSFDRLSLVLLSCAEEDYGESHCNFMEVAGPKLQKVLGTAGECLQFGVDAACVAGFTNEQIEKAKGLSQRAKDEVYELTNCVRKLAGETGDAPGEEPHMGIVFDLMDEYAVCGCASGFGMLAHTYLDDLIQFHEGNMENFAIEMNALVYSPRALLDGLFKKPALFGALRNFLAIACAFYIGLTGYSLMIKKYSGYIPLTVCILAHESMVPSVSKNINRIVGLVFGTILGYLLWALLGWCTLHHILLMRAITILWVNASMYCYFSSAKYGTMGMLLAAFGTPPQLKKCSPEVFNPVELYYKVSDTTIAVVVLMVFDILVQYDRPTRLSCHYLMKGWRKMETRFAALFSEEPGTCGVEEMAACYGEMFDLFSLAQDLGSQAKEEPRLWRTEWKSEPFEHVIEHALAVRANLNAMERLVTGYTTGQRHKVFTAMCAFPSFKLIVHLLLEKVIATRKCLDIFAHEVDEHVLTEEERSSMDRDTVDDVARASHAFVQKAGKELSQGNLKELNDQQNPTLDNDGAAIMAFVLVGLKSILVEVTAIDDVILQQ